MTEKLNIPPSVFMMYRRQFMMTAAAGALAAGSAPLMAFADTAAEIVPATPLADLPRAAQLVLGWSVSSPIGVTNPWGDQPLGGSGLYPSGRQRPDVGAADVFRHFQG